MTLPNTKKSLPAARRGFTLIELLVVIGILAVLLTITLIAINPSRQSDQANNTKRRSDVNTILNAVGQYGADNKGNLTPLGIPAIAATICKGAGCAAGSVDLCALIVPTYVSALPVDPDTNTGTPVTDCSVAAYNTGYTISQNATTNRVVVSAPAAKLNEVISVTR